MYTSDNIVEFFILSNCAAMENCQSVEKLCTTLKNIRGKITRVYGVKAFISCDLILCHL